MSLPLTDEGASRSNIMDTLPGPQINNEPSVAGTRHLAENSNYLFTPWVDINEKGINWMILIYQIQKNYLRCIKIFSNIGLTSRPSLLHLVDVILQMFEENLHTYMTDRNNHFLLVDIK